MVILQRKFYQRSTQVVARELLGMILVRIIDGQIISGIITETEAYGSIDDPASHVYCGKTKRNAAMFGLVGSSYVYLSYGMHHCINLVAYAKPHQAGAVLIRSIKPLNGIDMMRYNRNFVKDSLLTNGPGKLSQALSIDLKLNMHDITQESELYILDNKIHSDIIATPRIGISRAKELLWRFVM